METQEDNQFEDWQSTPTTGEQLLINLSLIMDELGKVNEGAYSPAKAKKMAALALKTQMDMLDVMTEADARSKVFKNIVENEEAKAYFDAKKSDGKHTENSLKHSIALAQEVLKAKEEVINAEKEAKKWSNSFNLAGSAHHFFKNLQG